MSRILTTIKQEKGEVNYVAGKVTFVREGQDGRVVNIGMSLNVYDPETKTSSKKYITLNAWNNDDAEKAQLADRVRKAKVDTGSYILVKCGTLIDDGEANNGTPRVKASVFDFQYNWFGAVETDEGQKRSIIVGSVRSIRDSGDYFKVGVPVETNRGGKKETKWYNITFSNGKSSMADTARKILKQGSAIAVLGSELTVKTGENGSEFNDFYGNILDVKYEDATS
jgi:hypothetical protein